MQTKKRWKKDRALVRAIIDDDADAALAALDAGTEPNHTFRHPSGNLTMPLILAASWGRPKIVALLLHRGADYRLMDEHGLSALHAASDATTLRVLLEAGADPELRAADGFTPLHLVLDEASARLLIEYGADFRVLCADGRRPVESLEMLVEKVRSNPAAGPEQIAAGEAALAYVRSLEEGLSLEVKTPSVSMTAEEEAAKAQGGRF